MNVQSDSTADSELAARFQSEWEASGDTVPDVFEFLVKNSNANAREQTRVLLADQYQRWQAGCELPVEEYFARCAEALASDDSRFELIIEELGYLEERDGFVDRQKFADRFANLPAGLRDELGRQLSDCRDRVQSGSSESSSGKSTGDQTLPEGKVGGTEATASPPERIGRYIIRATIGSGTFGVVYRADDADLQRPVAIKVPTAEHVKRAGGRDSFLREARMVAQLDHTAIVPVYDVGVTETGECFVVSKFIDGEDLSKRMRNGFSMADTLQMVARIARGLHSAHQQGVVHRDVKPANILLDTKCDPFIVDFGLALRDEDFGTGSDFVGTPAYMSPEQARGEGHRVDARSDVFSLGVVLYEMLTGRRPWRGVSQDSILEQVRGADVRPLRQLNDSIPRGVERICLKAMARRAVERYSTALDLAEDLEEFLADHAGTGASDTAPMEPLSEDARSSRSDGLTTTRGSDGGAAPPSADSTHRNLTIVPRGLRSFNAGDADFFQQLVPGPRDRFGLPDSIRFWRDHIESTDADDTFSVGLIYGPSGSGKSSLVKAGLLPVISKRVEVIYLEATPDSTESRLLKSIRKNSLTDRPFGSLVESIGGLRRESTQSDHKTLIVIDQFEQWLHAWPQDEDAELVQALRQCDGANVQAIVMVRDDFWMAATRFMREIEIPLIEGQNSSAVDLFDQRHARRVLAASGRAYGALPSDPDKITKSQQQFVRDAVADLADDGKVIPVRLALFAEMVKSRDWQPDTLRQLGGTQGVGIAFLEEAFGPHAPPQNRLHCRAAREVLSMLLPQHGVDIRGHRQPRERLVEAAGYANRDHDFEELLRILDTELRIITPAERDDALVAVSATDAETVANDTPRPYQLTHDYLVTSVREWLNRRQQSTIRGRAELKLEQRADLWNARPESRMLPTLWEFATIRALTQRANWTEPQRRMMAVARGRYGRKALFTVAIVTAIAFGLFEWSGRRKAVGLLDQLSVAQTADVPKLLPDVHRYERWTHPLLKAVLADPQSALTQRRHAAMALLDTDSSHVPFLVDQIVESRPDELAVLVRTLKRHSASASERLWTHIDAGNQDIRLNAAAALAELDKDSERFAQAARFIASDLVEARAGLTDNLRQLQPIRDVLVGPLIEISKQNDVARRRTAAIALEQYLDHSDARLVDLLQYIDAEQFRILAPRLDGASREHVQLLEDQFHAIRHTPWPDDNREKQRPTPADWTVNELTTAFGMLSEHFAFCQKLPFDRFTDVANELGQSGFRPIRIRPYNSSGGLRIAAVWTRDTLRFDWAVGITRDELEARHTDHAKDGLLAEDIAGYLVDGVDEPRFAMVWTESTVTGERREFHVGLPAEKHDTLEGVYVGKGLREFSRHLFTDRDGRLRHSMIWSLDDRHRDAATFFHAPESLMQNQFLSRACPVDVTVGRAIDEETKAVYAHYGGIWLYSDPDFDREIRLTRDLSEHVSQSHELANHGYRPAAMSVAEITDELTHAASIWIRPKTTADAKLRSAKQQANSAAALVRIGRPTAALQALNRMAAPALRTELIHAFHSHQCDPAVLLDGLERTKDDSVRRAVILALGEYDLDQIPTPNRQSTIDAVYGQLRRSSDAGVHCAADWCLRRWGQSARVARVQKQAPNQPTGDRRWYVDGQGNVMSVIDLLGAGPQLIGSPLAEPDTSGDERRHRKLINRRFAIAARELTVEQFERFTKAFPEIDFASRPGSPPGRAQTRLTWYHAAQYCNWLSEQEGIPQDQWCYYTTINDKGLHVSLAKNYLERTGYRLPTEAEWEFACRAGSLTTRPFGDTDHRLGEFAWYNQNSDGHIHQVGRLKPNDFGLFDMLGNAREWCLERRVSKSSRDRGEINPDSEDTSLNVHRGILRVTKGGSFSEIATKLRSSNRIGFYPHLRLTTHGFRVARTLQHGGTESTLESTD